MIHRFSVSAVILQEDRVLLVRHRRLGRWMYPGGYLEADEDPVDGLRREIREELGIDIELVCVPPVRHLAVKVLPAPFLMLSFDTDDSAEARRQVDMVYICRPLRGTPVPSDSELSGYAWVSIDDVDSLDLPPELPAVIRAAVVHARLNGEAKVPVSGDSRLAGVPAPEEGPGHPAEGDPTRSVLDQRPG